MSECSLDLAISTVLSEHSVKDFKPDDAVVKVLKNIFRHRISLYKSAIISEGEPDPLIDAFVDGSVAGYNEAIAQLIEHIENGCL